MVRRFPSYASQAFAPALGLIGGKVLVGIVLVGKCCSGLWRGKVVVGSCGERL
jgi:hypothetical protein